MLIYGENIGGDNDVDGESDNDDDCNSSDEVDDKHEDDFLVNLDDQYDEELIKVKQVKNKMHEDFKKLMELLGQKYYKLKC